MKIFGKKYGWKMFSINIGGKPSTVTVETKEESEKLTDELRKASEGDLVATEKIRKRVEKPVEERMGNSSESKKLIEQVKEKQSKVAKAKKSRKKLPKLEILENDPRFEVKTNKDKTKSYFFKGYKAELPPVFVEKLVELISKGKNIDHLENFWQLTLLNDNAQARRDLYKYLTKQNIAITKEGYFVTFRSIVKVKDKTSMKNSDVVGTGKETILEFAAKVKGWNKGSRKFEVYEDRSGTLYLKPIKDHEKNGKEFTFKGVLFDLVEAIKTEVQPEVEKVEVFTDNYTKTMVIKIGEPVRMDRAKCNSNPNVECSYGLHVGTPTFVNGSDYFGSVKVACLVNPMHVVSVPYADAHKMRVCEYLPFKIVTPAELVKFDEIDIDVYEQAYKAIENKKLLKALEVIDTLTLEEKDKFTVQREVTSLADIEKLVEELNVTKEKLSEKVKESRTLLEDDVSKTLSIDEVKRILNSRLK